ncbi:MAG: pseudaminic acid synthase [Candidatus Lokiarchaeota archaeon]|nr:pseudaminic acid synthase [Candidatus Lokiarchaeota archaeon]
MEFKIGNHIIGENHPCYIIAEMSANHGGSIDSALKIVEKAKESGADCLKIQTYTADTLTINSDEKFFKIKKGTWKGRNLYELYKEAYTPWEWHEDIGNKAESLGLDFLSTAYDSSSVDFLESLGVKAYKIASYELVDIPLIKYIASKGKPIFLSTGLATLEEINDAVHAIKSKNNNNFCLLKCSSSYPAKPEELNLLTIKDLKKRFKVPIGFSDHSMNSISAITAIGLGIDVIEKHFCLNRNIKTPDSSFSLDPAEFEKMVKQIRIAEKSLGKITYNISDRESESQIFRKSIFVVEDINKGDYFSKDNIRVIRPSNGLAPKYYNDVLGKKASKDIKRGIPLTRDMIG